MVKCSVNLCPGKAKSKFPFPHNNHELCSQWIQTCCQDDPNWTPNPASRVCEVHFNEIDFEIVPYGKTFRKKLREGETNLDHKIYTVIKFDPIGYFISY